MESPKTWGTAQEIANLRLPGVPISKPGVLKRAKREKWPFRPYKGKGRGREFPLILVIPKAPVSGMTKDLRDELKRRLKLLKVAFKEAEALMARLSEVLKDKELSK